MLVKIFRPLGAMVAATVLCASAWAQAPAQETKGTGQAPGQKNWKDRAEYDLYESITKEQDANKRLGLLNQWKEKYSATDFKQERLLLFLNTYQGLNQAAPMYQTAKEIVTNDPADMTGLYWLNMLAPVQPNAATTPDVLDTAEKAANGILQNVDKAFAAEKKPPAASEADWKKARNDMEALGHKTLGWSNMAKKNNEEAEKHLRESLKLNPAAGEVAYWLGSTLYAQKKVPEALFYFARASHYEGPGGLAPQARKDIDAYLVKAYKGYHGDEQGLDQVKALAKTTPAPPPDFKILSVTEKFELDQQKLQQAAKEDPQGTLWTQIKGELTSDNGPAYFDGSMKGAKPPEKSFRGKVVSSTAKEVVLAMSDETTPEATLRFEAAVPKVEPGTTLFFTGIANSFTRDPFMVTFDAEKADVEGWPAPAPPKAKGRRPARRK